MRKQDAVAPVFLPGPPVVPDEIAAWRAAHPGDLVKLPFTVWRGPLGEVERAAVGVHATAPVETVHLDGGALGIALDDRLRGLCGATSPCAVWLSGRFGPGLLATEPAEDRFGVHAVHEVVDPGTVPRAHVARPPECLAIRTMVAIHCARGTARCATCREVAARPPAPRLLDLCPEGPAARPVVEVERDGARRHVAFDVVRVFDDPAAARAFASAHGITDVVLDP